MRLMHSVQNTPMQISLQMHSSRSLWASSRLLVMQDSLNPLAISELHEMQYPNNLDSTHPLSGKRISALMKQTLAPKYDLANIEAKLQIDTNRLYR